MSSVGYEDDNYLASGQAVCDDSLIELNRARPVGVDIGLYASYQNSGLKYTGLFSDASDSFTWKLFTGEANPPTANVMQSITSFGNLSLNTIKLNAGNANEIVILDSNKNMTTTTAGVLLTDSYIRGLFSESNANLTYDNSTGVFGFVDSPTFTNETLTGALQCKGLATIGYDFGVSGGVKISTAAYGKPTVESLDSALSADILYLNPAGGAIQTGSGGLLSRGILAVGYESGVNAGVRITRNTYAKPSIEALTSAGATETLYLNPTGGYVSIGSYLGVGVAAPGAMVDVAGFIRTTGLVGTPSSGKGIETFYHTTNDLGYIQSYDRTGSAYKPLTLEASYITLNSTGGKVGIGTNAAPDRKLVLQGTSVTRDPMLYIKQSNDYGYSFNLDSFSTGKLSIVGVNNGVETVPIICMDRSSTYVGIGTSSPATALAVQGNIAICGGSPLDFSSTGQGTRYGYIYHSSSYMEFNNQQNGNMLFSTNNAEKMRISSTGNVGINDTSPAFKCVVRDQTTSPQLSLIYSGTSAVNNKELQFGYNGSSGNGYGWIQSIANGTAYTPLVLQQYGSTVGIGTTNPQSIFHVSAASSGSGIGILEDRSGGALNIELQFRSQYVSLANSSKICASIMGAPSNDGGRLIFNTTQNSTGTLTERMRITDFGCVGINGGPTATNGYLTVLDIYGRSIGPGLRLQESSGSGRGHIQFGASSTNDNNVCCGNEGAGAFYFWKGQFGSTTEMFRIQDSGVFSTCTYGYNASTFTGSGGSYVNMTNSANGYGSNMGMDGVNTFINNGGGGAIYLSTYTANYAALVGRLVLDSSANLTHNGNFSIPRTKAIQFDNTPTSLDMSIHMPNTGPYGLRISGANDTINRRDTDFGYYAAGVWQSKFSIQNYTGDFYTKGYMFVYNTTTPGTPSGGGIVYVESGALKYKGSSGTITTIAPA